MASSRHSADDSRARPWQLTKDLLTASINFKLLDFRFGDRLHRKVKDCVARPVKRQAPEGDHGYRFKTWMSSNIRKCSFDVESLLSCEVKTWSEMMEVYTRAWSRRCTVRICEVGPGTNNVRSNLKWKLVGRGIVLSTCFISAVRFELYRSLGVLVPVTIVVAFSMLPKTVCAASQGVAQVSEIPAQDLEEVGYSDDQLHSLDYELFLNELPLEILGRILGNLRYELVFQLKPMFRNVKYIAESDEFQASPLRKKPSLTACYFFIESEVWNWAGFDAASNEWRLLPSLTSLNLPANCKPDPDLFKEFLICANNGLVCMNFSKSADRERLVVFNPLSGIAKELPPLHHRRNPVLMHMLVDPVTKSYQVIVVGSSKSGDEDLSRITEVFDSRTGIWEKTGDVLGLPYALNEYQSGVYQDGKLFCIGFVEENGQVGKGIIGYDMEEGKWSSKWMHLLPFCTSSTILQLVENNGEVFLFSERESGRSTGHWVDKVEWTQSNEDETKNKCQLTTVIQQKKVGGWSLEVYPEFTCVPYDEDRLCIVNTIDHTGMVHQIRHPGQDPVPLAALPGEGFRGELGFFSLNPLSFTVQPRFSRKVYQRAEQQKCIEGHQELEVGV